jgi:TonB family protein
VKLSAIFLAIASFAITACSTNSTGLPFGDMRFVAPEQFERKPLPKFFPTPFVLKAEFIQKRLSGHAVIGFTVSREGKPEKIKIVHSTNQELAQIAAAYVSHLEFVPARIGGAPVACEVEMPFFNK